jgi:hypothetical protein
MESNWIYSTGGCGFVCQRHDCEFDRYRGAVFSDARYRENIAVAVPAFAALHDLLITVPMALSQPFRDDDVERLPDSIFARVPENSFRPGIPETNDAILIGGDNCIGARSQ